MGGYGAYKIALSTNRFSHAAALSGAFYPDGQNKILESFRPKEYWNGIFERKNFDNSQNNLMHLAKQKLACTEDVPKLYDWCGKQDFLYQDNQKFISELSQIGIQVNANFTNGKHDWYYWDKFLEDILNWLPIDYLPEERLC